MTIKLAAITFLILSLISCASVSNRRPAADSATVPPKFFYTPSSPVDFKDVPNEHGCDWMTLTRLPFDDTHGYSFTLFMLRNIDRATYILEKLEASSDPVGIRRILSEKSDLPRLESYSNLEVLFTAISNSGITFGLEKWSDNQESLGYLLREEGSGEYFPVFYTSRLEGYRNGCNRIRLAKKLPPLPPSFVTETIQKARNIVPRIHKVLQIALPNQCAVMFDLYTALSKLQPELYEAWRKEAKRLSLLSPEQQKADRMGEIFIRHGENVYGRLVSTSYLDVPKEIRFSLETGYLEAAMSTIPEDSWIRFIDHDRFAAIVRENNIAEMFDRTGVDHLKCAKPGERTSILFESDDPNEKGYYKEMFKLYKNRRLESVEDFWNKELASLVIPFGKVLDVESRMRKEAASIREMGLGADCEKMQIRLSDTYLIAQDAYQKVRRGTQGSQSKSIAMDLEKTQKTYSNSALAGSCQKPRLFTRYLQEMQAMLKDIRAYER